MSLNRSGSPQMPRSMEGHGSRMTRKPPCPSGTELPFSSTTSSAMPGSGTCAEPGLVAVTPGSGAIIWAPVSVCHPVSTIGAGFCLPPLPPMTSRYHIQVSGLMGSPAEPRTRMEERSYLSGMSPPHVMNVRGGGGVRMETLYFSTFSHQRHWRGECGVPSYMAWVAPLMSGA